MIGKYIDLDWYNEVYGKKFINHSEATKYYLTIGERKGDFPNPLFDPTYYRQYTYLDVNQSCLMHYLSEGKKNNLRPSRYFDAHWYRWQNPDMEEYGCSILHYLLLGAKEYRDPCPEVDMVALSRRHSQFGDGAVLTYLLSVGYLNPGDKISLTKDDSELVARQRIFLKAIKPQLNKSIDSRAKGNNLLFVQCAKDSEFWKWFKPDLHRDWDLFINCYTEDFPLAHVAEYVCKQHGTKFTGILKCWLYFPEIFDRYDNIFFIDDDLIFRFEDISIFFKHMERNLLDIAQPSLTSTSQCAWQVFYNVLPNGVRRTNGVEIMMPALSKRARNVLLPYFVYSVSGFGLDLLFAKLASRYELPCGIIDSVVVSHEKKIDQVDGSYYEFLRSKGINSKYELYRLVRLFGLGRSLHEISE